MLIGISAMAFVPQRAFHSPHRGRRHRAVSMAPVSAPQAPVQTGSADEQQEAFSAIIDRCENFAEDFGAFLGVAEELREVFEADFEQYRLELRADATSQNVRY